MADRFLSAKRLKRKFSTDTLWGNVRLLNQHKYTQVYTHKCGFTVVYPMDNMTGGQHWKHTTRLYT